MLSVDTSIRRWAGPPGNFIQLSASVCDKMREIVWERADMAVFWLDFVFLRMTIATESVRMAMRRFLPHWREFEKFSKLNIAA
jgi:hypothetical protein